MRKAMVLGVLLVIAAIGVAGCGSSSDAGSTAAPSGGGGSSATITLPDGWTMEDAITPEEVGAITGKTMESFPEASSAAQAGRPASSFTAVGVDGSKIYFGADVQGGQEGYDTMTSYAESGSLQEVGGVGDKAAVLAFSDGRAGVVVLSGDLVLRIDWDPTVYTGDLADFGSQLANAVLANLYK
jgi:hypothetical protein